MLRGAKNTVQGTKMAFGTPFLATCIGVALRHVLQTQDSEILQSAISAEYMQSGLALSFLDKYLGGVMSKSKEATP